MRRGWTWITLTVIRPQDIDTVLPPLPVTRLRGLDKVMAVELASLQIRSIADLWRELVALYQRHVGTTGPAKVLKGLQAASQRATTAHHQHNPWILRYLEHSPRSLAGAPWLAPAPELAGKPLYRASTQLNAVPIHAS
jgi:hypothetical protein